MVTVLAGKGTWGVTYYHPLLEMAPSLNPDPQLKQRLSTLPT